MDTDVPEAWKDAAEEVRAHLCALRGGGPFLSPADSLQLLQWLERGVSVAAVLVALERAADARRRSGRRVPLSLVAAKRHLGRPMTDRFFREAPTRGAEPNLAPVVRALQLVPSTVDGRARAELVADLDRIDGDGDEAVQRAMSAVRRFLDAVWDALGEDGRAVLRNDARAELGDLLGFLDDPTGAALVEEGARDVLRRRYPSLAAGPLTLLLSQR